MCGVAKAQGGGARKRAVTRSDSLLSELIPEIPPPPPHHTSACFQACLHNDEGQKLLFKGKLILRNPGSVPDSRFRVSLSTYKSIATNNKYSRPHVAVFHYARCSIMGSNACLCPVPGHLCHGGPVAIAGAGYGNHPKGPGSQCSGLSHPHHLHLSQPLITEPRAPSSSTDSRQQKETQNTSQLSWSSYRIFPSMVIITEFRASVQYYGSSGEGGKNPKCKPLSSFHSALSFVQALPSAPPGTLPSSVCLFFFVICTKKGTSLQWGGRWGREGESATESTYPAQQQNKSRRNQKGGHVECLCPQRAVVGIRVWSWQ